MITKPRVGILLGGQSAEHEVSLQSAKNVFEAIDKDKYDVIVIGIDKEGGWYLQNVENFLLNADDPNTIQLHPTSERLAIVPGKNGQQFVQLSNMQPIAPLDVIFPVLHGPYGEDGTIQGLCKLMDIPFVGAGVLGSAVGMDKDVMKRLLREAGIPTPKCLTLYRATREKSHFQQVKETLGLPLFIKPANLGSSVGVSKVNTEEEFIHAIEEAFQYDRKILIEEYIPGREIECSVLGNEHPIASLPGEIITNRTRYQFYSYQAKYIDESGAKLGIPADLPDNVITTVQELALKTFKVIGCEGMARIDCFLTDDQQVLINEPNTIPGFTRISMYPKLWEVSGISYSELIERLIQLALERYEQEKALATSFKP